MKILMTINDISITGGAERVVVNLANALVEQGHKVEILSFFKTNETLPYRINESVNLHIWHNIAESVFSAQMCRNVFSKIYYKNCYKFILNICVYFKFKNFDAFICNDSTYAPFLKRKGARYIKLVHLNFSRFSTRNSLFHTLIILSAKELHIWQSYHNNVQIIPNFLSTISTKQIDSMQKCIISVGRMDKSDQKGFLRLIDIWALVQESFKSSMPPPNYILGSLLS